MLVLTDHRVAFPVPDRQALLDRALTFRDVTLTRQHAARIFAVVPFASLLGHDPRVPVERPTGLLVLEDVPIDRLVTDRPHAFGLHRRRNLLWAPFPFQQLFHLLHLFRAEPGRRRERRRRAAAYCCAFCAR